VLMALSATFGEEGDARGVYHEEQGLPTAVATAAYCPRFEPR
jgi:hypothetical protein